MKEFEITGDTRPYHFPAPNPAVATVLVLMLGNGKYGWRDLRHSENEFPVARIKMTRTYWCKDKFGMTDEDLLRKVSTTPELLAALWRALQSIALGLPGAPERVEPQDYRDLRIKGRLLAEQIQNRVNKGILRQARIH